MGHESNEYSDAEEKYLKNRVYLFFSDYSESDPIEVLKMFEEYYKYISDRVDPVRFQINADTELLDAFESISLSLKERMRVYPDSVRHQIEKIFDDNAILQTFSIFASMSSDELKRIKYSRSLVSMISKIPLIGFGQYDVDDYGLNRKKLFEIKIALKRISGIVKFAKTQNVLDYDSTFVKYKDHYDPEIINRNKLSALINILKVQLAEIPDIETSKRLEEKLESIEEELKKPKPKWGAIITGFFILFGFLADLKTIQPDIYEHPYETMNKIISVLHSEAQVGNADRLLKFPINGNEKTKNRNDQNLIADISSRRRTEDEDG